MPTSDPWSAFFTVLAPIAGAIVALLIVAYEQFATKWQLIRIRHAAAVRGLIELAAPLTISLFFLYPGQRWWIGSIIAGIVGLVTAGICFCIYCKDVPNYVEQSRLKKEQYIGALIPGGIFLALFVLGGVRFWGRNEQWNVLSLCIIGWICIWSTIAGVGQAYLLLTVDKPELKNTPAPPPEVQSLIGSVDRMTQAIAGMTATAQSLVGTGSTVQTAAEGLATAVDRLGAGARAQATPAAIVPGGANDPSTLTQEQLIAGFAGIVAEVTDIDPSDVTSGKSLVDDLDISSLTMVQIAMQCEDKYGVRIPDDDLPGLRTVGDVVAYIQQLAKRDP